MRVSLIVVWCAIALLHAATGSSVAAQERGCCQFYARSATGGTHGRGTRQCLELTPQDCTLTRAPNTFFRGFHCNADTARCVLVALPATPVAATPTPTPTAVHLGCCQLDRGASNAVCGNQVSEVSCLTNFDGQPRFCADCACSSHVGPGFDLSPGQCVARSPTPTATPSDPRGCCQLDNLRRARNSVCGNAIARSSCVNDFDARPTFCADCACSSHPDAGFDLSVRGECRASSTPARARGHTRPVRRPGHS